MVSRDSLVGTILSHLPKGVELKYISAHARLRCGLNRSWGETYFIVHKNELILLTRSSVFEPYVLVKVEPGSIPRLEKGANQSDVYVKTEDGETCRLPVAPAERDRLERLIVTFEKVLARPEITS